MKFKAILVIILLFVFVVPNAGNSFSIDGLINKIRGEAIEDKKENTDEDPVEITETDVTQVEDNSISEIDPMEDIQSLIKSENYEEAITRINDFIKTSDNEKMKPFMMYLGGQIYAYNLQDQEKARNYYKRCAADFPDTRYGMLALEKEELLSEGTITELKLKEKVEGTKSEIDLVSKQIEELSFFNFIKKAKLEKKLKQLQSKYLSQRELLLSFEESPESLLGQYMSKKNQRAEKPGRISSKPAQKVARCIKDSYNVRAKPWGEVLGQVKKGDKMLIIGEEKAKGKIWYKIKIGNLVGFCHQNGLAIENSGTIDDAAGDNGVLDAEMPQDEFQSWIVKNLVKILYSKGKDPVKLSDSAVFNFFIDSPVLSRQFPEVISSRDTKEMKKILVGLSRMLHYTPLRKAINSPLAKADYFNAYKTYKAKYLKNYDDPSIYSFKEDAVPTIIVNVPSRKLRVYRDGLLILDVPMVPGRSNKASKEGNIQTRVGKFKLTSWHESYTTSSYPNKWSEDPWKGAFGKYCAKMGPNSHGQHIHGTYGPEWIGNIPINYAPGSHGCIRLANKNITKLKAIAPKGTKIIKTYCLHERYVKRGILGENFKASVYDNVYDYKIESLSDGCFYSSAGVMIGHKEPEDAVR